VPLTLAAVGLGIAANVAAGGRSALWCGTSIADGTLSTNAELEEELRRLKRRAGDQPSG
jgi:hypothetical protein